MEIVPPLPNILPGDSTLLLVVVNVVGVLTHCNTIIMHFQCKRVHSLEFLPVAILVVESPSASHFIRLGDITPQLQ